MSDKGKPAPGQRDAGATSGVNTGAIAVANSGAERSTGIIGVAHLIQGYLASDPGTVAAYLALVLASTATGIAGVAKFAALLSLNVSVANKDGAFKALAALACLFVLQRLLTYGADRLHFMLSAHFCRDTTTKLVTNVLDANRTAVVGAGPLQYTAHVDATARAAACLFDACVGTYLPCLLMLTCAAGYIFYLDFRCGLVFVAAACAVAAVLFVSKDQVGQQAVAAEQAMWVFDARMAEVLARVSIDSADSAQHREMVSTAHSLAKAQMDLGATESMVNLVASGVVIACALLLMFMAVRKVGMRDVEVTAVLTLIFLVGTSRTWLATLTSTSVDVLSQMGRCSANTLAGIDGACGTVSKGEVARVASVDQVEGVNGSGGGGAAAAPPHTGSAAAHMQPV